MVAGALVWVGAAVGLTVASSGEVLGLAVTAVDAVGPDVAGTDVFVGRTVATGEGELGIEIGVGSGGRVAVGVGRPKTTRVGVITLWTTGFDCGPRIK